MLYRDRDGKERTIKEVCPVAGPGCVKGCREPRRNCVKLALQIRRGNLDWMPEDPGEFFIHWDGVLQGLEERAIANASA